MPGGKLTTTTAGLAAASAVLKCGGACEVEEGVAYAYGAPATEIPGMDQEAGFAGFFSPPAVVCCTRTKVLSAAAAEHGRDSDASGGRTLAAGDVSVIRVGF